MIIIKTKNGDRFINDKAVTMVEHDREKAVVDAYGDNGVFFHIEDVESVIYTNDAQPTSWKDEGSEIQRLTKELSECMKNLGNLRDEYRKIDDERYHLKAKVGNLQVKLNKLNGTTEELKPTEAETNSETKITLRATSPMGSDCTQAYNVEGCDGMTVGDFIQAVIKNDPYVDIDILRDGKYIWSGEYTKQELQNVDASIKPLSEDQLRLKVESARASGGWGRMSYRVKLW